MQQGKVAGNLLGQDNTLIHINQRTYIGSTSQPVRVGKWSFIRFFFLLLVFIHNNLGLWLILQGWFIPKTYTERTYGWAEPRRTRCRTWWLDVNQSHHLELEKKVMLNTSLDQHIIHLLGVFLKVVGEQVNLQKNRSDMSYQSLAHFTNWHLLVKHTPSLKDPNLAIQRFGEFSLQATRRMEGTPSSFNAVGLGVFGRLGGYVETPKAWKEKWAQNAGWSTWLSSRDILVAFCLCCLWR